MIFKINQDIKIKKMFDSKKIKIILNLNNHKDLRSIPYEILLQLVLLLFIVAK